MKLQLDKFHQIFNEYANGNYNKFSALTKIDVALLYRILNGKCNAGLKTLNLIFDFCKSNNIEFQQLFF